MAQKIETSFQSGATGALTWRQVLSSNNKYFVFLTIGGVEKRHSPLYVKTKISGNYYLIGIEGDWFTLDKVSCDCDTPSYFRVAVPGDSMTVTVKEA